MPPLHPDLWRPGARSSLFNVDDDTDAESWDGCEKPDDQDDDTDTVNDSSSESSSSSEDNDNVTVPTPNAIPTADREIAHLPDGWGEDEDYKSVAELQWRINELFGRDNGFAVVRRGGCNRQQGELTRWDIVCDRYGKPRPSRARSRKTSSRKCGCQWRGLAVKKDGRWIFKHTQDRQHLFHNHPPSLDPSSHPQHRRLTTEEATLLKNTMKQESLRAREIGDILRREFEDNASTRRDIYNRLACVRKSWLRGYTPVGALIKRFDEMDIPYRVQWEDDDEDQLQCLMWINRHMVTIMKKFPEVLFLDMTYNTNRFKLPFYHANTIPNVNTNLSLFFGLVNNEKRRAFDFLFTATKEIRGEHGIPDPDVIITDFQAEMKAPLAEIFPNPQQQIYLYHILKNIYLNARVKLSKSERRRDDPDDDDEENRDDDVADLDEQDRIFLKNLRDGVDNLRAGEAHVPSDIKKDARGFVIFFKVLVYAKTEEKFWNVWAALVQYFKDENPLLRYIQKTWMPVRDQWAHHLIKHYCNFGGRVTSSTEASNLNIKSFLITGRHSVASLVTNTDNMTHEQRRVFKQKVADDAVRVRYEYLGKPYLSQIVTKVSGKALDLINEEYRHVLGAVQKDGRLPSQPLGPCSENCTVAPQYGIPCRHVIMEKLGKKEQLTLEDVHHHWHLVRDLADRDPYLRLKNPKMAKTRGRPKNSRAAMPAGQEVPEAEVPASNKQSTGKRASRKRTTKVKAATKKQARKPPSTSKVPKKKGPGPTKGNAPRLAASIRRHYSQWELAEQEDARLAIASSAHSQRNRRGSSTAETITVEAESVAEGVSMGPESNRDSGVVIASKATSPRKTRSGRVIKPTSAVIEGRKG